MSSKVQRRLFSAGLDVAPILAALLMLTVLRTLDTEIADWGSFLATAWGFASGGWPLIVAHLAGLYLPHRPAMICWIALAVVIPALFDLLEWDIWLPLAPEWFLAALVSAMTLLLLRRDGRAMIKVPRLIVTLNGTVITLLVASVLAMTALRLGAAETIASQSSTDSFDTGLAIGTLFQFSLIALLIWLYLWICRYVLVRGVLEARGWFAFVSTALIVWIVATPVIASLALALPIASEGIQLLPSGNSNPFAGMNYQFAFALGATHILLVLASERLMHERGEAMSLHASARAELDMLHQQINPHFLFNTLNTLYALCLKGRDNSAQAVLKLSDLLRYSVYETQAEWVRLDGEVTQILNYLDLQMLRFGDRCKVVAQWPENAGAWMIPPQALMILVENAFKHGVEPVDANCTIDIELTLAEGRLIFTCINTPATPVSDDRQPGVGLLNLRRRLEILLGEEFVLSSERAGDGWHAHLELEARPC